MSTGRSMVDEAVVQWCIAKWHCIAEGREWCRL